MDTVEPTAHCRYDDPQIIFAGSPFCDVILTGIEALPGPGQESWATGRLVSAGGSANRAVAAARLGVRVAMVGAVGTDAFGRIVGELLAAEQRIDRRWLRSDPDWQTPVSIALTDGLDRRFLSSGEFGIATKPVLDHGGPPTATYVQTGVSLVQVDWIQRQRAAGAVIVAEAARAVGQDRSAEVLRGLAAVDILIMNADEACEYAGAASPSDAAQLLTEHVPLVVVTTGDGGAIAVDAADGRVVAVDAIPAEPVDTTGAGDVFTAGFLVAGLAGLAMDDRLRFGCVSAGLSVEGMGGAAGSPRRADLLRWARSARGRAAPRYVEAIHAVLDHGASNRLMQKNRPSTAMTLQRTYSKENHAHT